MGLGDLFKRLSKGSDPEKAAKPEPPNKGGKAMPPLPRYLKKDKFIREAPAGSPPTPELLDPNDIAEAGAFKRPGQWLKAKLGGVSDSQALDNVEKTKTALKKSGGLNDQEIQSFLDGLLEEPKEGTATEAKPSGPRGPKSP